MGPTLPDMPTPPWRPDRKVPRSSVWKGWRGTDAGPKEAQAHLHIHTWLWSHHSHLVAFAGS